MPNFVSVHCSETRPAALIPTRPGCCAPPGRNTMVAPRNRLSGSMGFTLLELLIAIAIFALIGMATYQMLTTVLRTDSVTRAQEQRLRELVRAMGAFERDLQQ